MMRRALLVLVAISLPVFGQPSGGRTSGLSRGLADALYAKLAGGSTIAGTTTFANLTITGTCTGCAPGAVPTTRLISTTAPLGGGGDLSADRTLTCTLCLTSAANSIALGNIAQIATNTILGNSTNATANITALSIGGCSTSSSALIWTTNTGFGCNTAVAASTVTTNANLTGPITSTGNATAVAAQTGTGSTFVMQTAPSVTGLGTDTLQASGNIGLGLTKSATAGQWITAGSAANQGDVIVVQNTDAADTSAKAALQSLADTASVFMQSHGTARNGTRLGHAIGGYGELELTAGSGLMIDTFGAVPLELGTNATLALKIDASQNVSLPVQAITAGTMTGTYEAVENSTTTCRSWTNAMVTALPTTAGDIAWGTLPAKTKVVDATIIITGQAAGPTTVTVALGRVSSTYIDYIVASDAKAAANTVYGDASGERGTNLTGYDLPSYTGTTVVNAHFASVGGNLSTVTGSTGLVCVTTRKLP